MNSKKSDRGAVGVRAPYMRVIGIEVETDGVGRASRDLRFTPDEEEEFRRLAAKPDVHSIIARYFTAFLLFNGSSINDVTVRDGSKIM